MRILPLSAAAVASAVLLMTPAPAAAFVDEGPATLHLKDDPDRHLVWEDDAVTLSAGGDDQWSVTSIEALVDLGQYQVVHETTGQCLSAEPMADGEETAPVTLVDCVDADPWTIVHEDLPSHLDYRFQTPEGHYLGSMLEEAEGDIEVIVHDVPESLHAHEWRALAAREEPPASDPVTDPVSDAAAPADPKLPQTGAGVAAIGAGGLIAVAAGTALTMWWRRHSLRTQW